MAHLSLRPKLTKLRQTLKKNTMSVEPDVPELLDIDENSSKSQIECAADEADEVDDDDEDGVENFAEPCTCLFCPAVQPSAAATLKHCAADHGFDLFQLRKELRLDFYSCMSLLNFIRSQPDASSVAERISAVKSELDLHKSQKESALTSGKYLQPKNAEDPILFSFEDDEDDNEEDFEQSPIIRNQSPDDAKIDSSVLSSQQQQQQLVSRYEAEIESLRQQIAQMTQVMHRVALDSGMSSSTSSSSSTTSASKSSPTSESDSGSDSGSDSDEEKQSNSQNRPKFASPSAPGKKKDQGYFDSYSEMEIHDVMLRDTVRTLAYRDFMYSNRALFADKVVLDIGCGTAILSLFAAQAGARRVIGVDRASIIDKAAVIVAANHKSDQITLVKGRVEELPNGIPEPKVDIIISEWMGYMLLYESMLSTVLYARDRWLAPGGVVHPSRARLFVAGMKLEAWRTEQRSFWSNVYGFDFGSILKPWPFAVLGGGATPTKEPLVEVIPADSICTDSNCIRDIDIMTVTDAELDFVSPFSLIVSSSNPDETCTLGALVLYFDTSFEAGCKQPHVVLDTSPQTEPTHWKQTLLFLNEPITVRAGDRIHGELRLQRPRANPRGYDLIASVSKNDEPQPRVQMYEMY